MKKKIIYLLLMTLPLLVVTSCEEDAIGTPDLNYITFEAGQVDLKVDKGSTNSANYKIYSSIMSDVSRTYSVTVSDKSTADPVSYTIPTSITMPANSNVASLQIDVEDINIISSRVLILKLEEKSGLFIGNDNEFTINLLRICVSWLIYIQHSSAITCNASRIFELLGSGSFFQRVNGVIRRAAT